MTSFTYKAVNSGGQNLGGTLGATSRAAALDALVRQGLTPVSLQEARSEQPAPVKVNSQAKGRVSPVAAESFIRELSNLLSGGVSLSRARVN